MISLAFLGVFTGLLLPGLAVVLWATRAIACPWQEKILFATPVNIVLSYFAVVLLTWMEVYSQFAIMAFGAVSGVAVLAYLLIHSRGKRITWAPIARRGLGLNERTFCLLLSLAALLPLLVTFSKTWWTVFSHWDAVTSWNRWAIQWFNGTPIGSWGYPPGLPILYSIVYKLGGSTNLQTVAKAAAAYFPFFGLFCIWRIGSLEPRHKRASLVAGVFFVFLIQKGFEGKDFVFSGYTDPIMASLGAFCLYVVVLARKNVRDGGMAPTLFVLLLSAIAIASAALIKQNGVILAALSVGCVMAVARSHFRANLSVTVGVVAFCALLASHWYLYSFFHWNDFVHAASLLDQSLIGRLGKALGLTAKVVGIPTAVAIAVGLVLERDARRIFLSLALPLWLFWAVAVSYDFRSAFVVLPFLAAVAGLGVEAGLAKLLDRFSGSSEEPARQHSFSAGMVVMAGSSVLLFSLIAMPWLYQAESLLASNDRLRIATNDNGFNREMVELFAQSGANEKTISCYNKLFNLPGAAPTYVMHLDCRTDYQEWLRRPDVKYLVHWSHPRNPRNGDEVRAAAARSGTAFRERKLAERFVLFEKTY
jgi:hypothetical protein